MLEKLFLFFLFNGMLRLLFFLGRQLKSRTLVYNTIPQYILQYPDIPYNTSVCPTIPRYTLQYPGIPYNTPLYPTMCPRICFCRPEMETFFFCHWFDHSSFSTRYFLFWPNFTSHSLQQDQSEKTKKKLGLCHFSSLIFCEESCNYCRMQDISDLLATCVHLSFWSLIQILLSQQQICWQ